MTEYAPNYPLSYPNPPFPYAPHSETPLRSCAVAVPRTPPPAVPGRPPYPVGQQWIGARESPTRPPPPSPPPNTFPLWDTLKYLFDTTSVQNSEVINHMYFDAPDVSEALDIPVSSMFMQKIYARMFPAPPPSPEKPPAAPLDYYAKLEEFQDAIDDSMTANQISDSFRGIFNQDLPASVTQSEVWQSIVSRAGNRRRSEEVVELVRRIQAHPVNAEAPTSESPRAASTLTPKPTHQMDVSEPASHQSINHRILGHGRNGKGTLTKICCNSGANLPDLDTFSDPDFSCTIAGPGISGTSPFIDGTRNPTWDLCLGPFENVMGNVEVTFSLTDEDDNEDDNGGSVTVSVGSCPVGPCTLTPTGGEDQTGTISVTMDFIPFEPPSPPTPPPSPPASPPPPPSPPPSPSELPPSPPRPPPPALTESFAARTTRAAVTTLAASLAASAATHATHPPRATHPPTPMENVVGRKTWPAIWYGASPAGTPHPPAAPPAGYVPLR